MMVLGLLSISLGYSQQGNQYLHFDGSNDYTIFNDASSYLYNTNTITMAGWFYTDQLNYGQGMMSIRGGGSGQGEMYVLQLDSGKLECRVVTNTGLKEVAAPAGTVVAGQWQHIAWVFAGYQVRLYINGILTGSSPASGNFMSSDRPFTIGRSILGGNSFYFGGRADEVSLWSKALTQGEIMTMMNNGLNGTESDLIAYYKCNQGTPGGDNSYISQLTNFTSDQTVNSDLVNFALNGTTSNFNGTLAAGFQTISILPIGDKTTQDSNFVIDASSTSGLPVTLTVESGPATVNGNTVTLTGAAGEVVIKASQPGNGIYTAADNIYASFNVYDPANVLVEAELLHPTAGSVTAPSLQPFEVAIKASIDHPELFGVSTVTASIGGTDVQLTDQGNGFFTGWYTPNSYGIKNVVINATNNYGSNSNTSAFITINSSATTQTVAAFDDILVNVDISSDTQTSILPSHIGAYTQILGTLHIDCPSGGCDPWDRVSSVEVQGKDGQWYEIIRYVTPYGVACQSSIDLTDFKSLLKGKTTFRVNLTTYSTGFLYSLDLNYVAGTDPEPYSTIEKLWYQTYQFGDMSNLQPTEDITVDFPTNTTSAKIKLVSSGHGWGENNTNNAAEFSHNIHHIWVNNSQTFTQDNWYTCNPNPDGCDPQAGTWYFPRAGWCPGSIAQFFDYSMTPYISGPVDLEYVFDTNYQDYCSTSNPNCISGVTCTDCTDTYNPHLIVSSYLISFGSTQLLGIDDEQDIAVNDINLYPNPSTGTFYVEATGFTEIKTIEVYDIQGRLITNVKPNGFGEATKLDITGQVTGVYLVKITDASSNVITKRLIKE